MEINLTEEEIRNEVIHWTVYRMIEIGEWLDIAFQKVKENMKENEVAELDDNYLTDELRKEIEKEYKISNELS